MRLRNDSTWAWITPRGRGSRLEKYKVSEYFVNFISSHFLRYEHAVGHERELAEVFT